MKLAQLVKLTPKAVEKNVPNTRLKDAKVSTLKKGNVRVVKAVVQRFVTGEVHEPHKVEIRGKTEGKVSEVDVLVWCDCGLQVYFGGEYVLTQKGASSTRYGNGDPPTTRNPNGVPYMCHHLVKLARLVLKKKV